MGAAKQAGKLLNNFTGRDLNDQARAYANVVLEQKQFVERDKHLLFDALYSKDTLLAGSVAMALDLLCGNVNPTIRFGPGISPGNRAIILMDGTASTEQASKLVEYVTSIHAIPVAVVTSHFPDVKEIKNPAASGRGMTEEHGLSAKA